MRMKRGISDLRWGAAVLAAGLVACGSRGPQHPAVGQGASAATAPRASAAERATAGMVYAVATSRSLAPVSLKFALRQRPQVGQTDEVDYALIPKVPGIDTLRVDFGSGEGLAVVSQGPSLAGVRPAVGTPILGSVTVRPTKEGLFTLTVAVGVGSPNGSVVWSFAIPVIAAAGPAQAVANGP